MMLLLKLLYTLLILTNIYIVLNMFYIGVCEDIKKVLYLLNAAKFCLFHLIQILFEFVTLFVINFVLTCIIMLLSPIGEMK